MESVVGNEVDDEITIVKIVRPWSDDDIEIVYEKGGVPLPNEINKGPSDFVDNHTMCHNRVTVSLDIVGLRKTVIISVPRPNPHQNQCRASEEGESPDESPHDLHDVHHANAQEAGDCPLEAEEEMDIVTAETTQSEGNSVPPRGVDDGLKNSTVHGAQGSNSKDPEDNLPIVTMTTGVNTEEGEMALKDPATSESQPDPTDGSTVSEEGHNLGGGRKVGERSKAKKRALKPSYCSQRGHLNVHLRSHLKESPSICNLCGKGLASKTSLEDHIRRHLKEKWFKCPHKDCSSSFVSAGELKKHSRVHSGEKPFACEYPNCGKHFTTKQVRDNHHRLHTGEKPFACGCGKKFAASSNMYQHRKKCEEGDDRVTKKRKICQDDEGKVA